jgi:hypothetical protein
LALVVCGSEAHARCAVADVLSTVAARVGPEDRAARLEIVVTTAEAAALRVFDPSDPGGCGPAIVDLRREPPSTDARVLAMAFARRLSWYNQAALWAVDVEGLGSRATARRLGKAGVRVQLEGARNDLRRAYLQLRTDLDEACVSTLRQTFRLSPAATATAPHPVGCPECVAQLAWLGDLGAALPILERPLPPKIRDAIKPPRDADGTIAPSECAQHPSEPSGRVQHPIERDDGGHHLGQPPEPAQYPSVPSEGAGDPTRRTPRGRRGSHALRSGGAPPQRTDSATPPRGRRSHARGSRGAAERMKASTASSELTSSPDVRQDPTLTDPSATPLQPPYPAEDATDQRRAALVGTVGTASSAAISTAGPGRRGLPEPAAVQAASTSASPRPQDSSPSGPAETTAAWPARTAADGPLVEGAARASRSSKAPQVTIPGEPGAPTGRAEDRTTLTDLESVTTSGPGA